MAEAGRPTHLDKQLFSKIKENILQGFDLRNTAKNIDIPESTLYGWHSDNYLNLADKIEGWKRDRMLKLAEGNLEAILCLGISDKDSLKVVQDTAKFVSETLGKKTYSKQVNQDITSGGKPLYLPSQVINKYDKSTSEPTEDSSESEEI